MSGDDRRDDVTPDADSDGGESGEQPAPTPFDNPFFLPVVLWGLAAWFGFDVLTGSEAYQKYPNFNRGGFALLGAAALYFTWSAIKARRGSEDRKD